MSKSSAFSNVCSNTVVNFYQTKTVQLLQGHRWQFNDLEINIIISNIFFLLHSLCNYLTCTSYVKKKKTAWYKAHINYQSTITSVR